MSVMAFQITCISIACSTVCSSEDQRKHQSSALLAFGREIHRSSLDFTHKGPFTRKCFHLMTSLWHDREMLLCISVLIVGTTVYSGHIETPKLPHGFQHQFFSRDGYVVFFDKYCVTVSDLVSTIPTLGHPFYVYVSSRFLSSMSSPCDRAMHLFTTVSLCSMPYCANYNSVSLLYLCYFCTKIYKCAWFVIELTFNVSCVRLSVRTLCIDTTSCTLVTTKSLFRIRCNHYAASWFP